MYGYFPLTFGVVAFFFCGLISSPETKWFYWTCIISAGLIRLAAYLSGQSPGQRRRRHVATAKEQTRGYDDNAQQGLTLFLLFFTLSLLTDEDVTWSEGWSGRGGTGYFGGQENISGSLVHPLQF